jgi:small subunit ribosomal protein S17
MSEEAKKTKREVFGEVVSTKMDKTIIVRVKRRFPHPRFGKIVTSFKKYYAHDEGNDAGIGDSVRIEESRPVSRLKRWNLVRVEHRNPDAISA